MVDFSEAERVGFSLAFVEFWLLHLDNTQSSEELHEVSLLLLKGCLQHFRSGVTQVKKISGAIPPALADAFEAQRLLVGSGYQCRVPNRPGVELHRARRRAGG